jgi:hypothetical protein
MKKQWKADMTFNSFKDLFYNNLSKTGNFDEAYNLSENEHEDMFNKKRYKNIKSFKVTLSRKS